MAPPKAFASVRSHAVRCAYALLTLPFPVWAVDRLVGGLLQDKVRHGGVVIDTSGPIVVPWVKTLIFWGFYEAPEIRFVKRYLRADRDVVELGSSIGVVASHIARKLQPQRRLVCVEADPALIDRVRTNLRNNAPEVGAIVVNAALSYTGDGRTSVDLAVGESNLSGRLLDPGTSTNYVTVPTTTLGALLREHDIGEYALVADIEGAEAGLIGSDGDALARCSQVIIELHDTTWNNRRFSVEDLCRRLLDVHGFSLRDRHRAVFVFEKPATKSDEPR